MSSQKLIEPSESKKADGDFVLESQSLASDAGFSKVSSDWLEKDTEPISVERERLASTRANREAITATIGELKPVVAPKGSFALQYRDRLFYPDRHSCGQLGLMLGTGKAYPQSLLSGYRKGDAEALAFAVAHGVRCADKDMVLTLRLTDGDRLRGILSANASWIRNEWYLGVLDEALPGARLSHYRGDEFTIYGNVLIPDTIREEDDSAYGAMVSIGNSEVGTRRFSQRGSLFRAICSNGCIWGQTKGQKLSVSRHSSRPPEEIRKAIVKNIHDQIPLAVASLQSLLGTRRFETEVAVKPLIAEVAREHHLSKEQATAVLQAWWVERRQTPDYEKSLFAIVNAVTRAGQGFGNETWVRFDEIGGRLASMAEDDWSSLVAKASRLPAKQVDRSFRRFGVSA